MNKATIISSNVNYDEINEIIKNYINNEKYALTFK